MEVASNSISRFENMNRQKHHRDSEAHRVVSLCPSIPLWFERAVPVRLRSPSLDAHRGHGPTGSAGLRHGERVTTLPVRVGDRRSRTALGIVLMERWSRVSSPALADEFENWHSHWAV